MQVLWKNMRESLSSVLPISLIVLFLHFTIAPMPLGTLVLFATGTVLLVLGMGLFSMGSDLAMMSMGELVGAKLMHARNLWLLIIISLIIGVSVTIAEPDLQVLSKQVPAVPDLILIPVVAVGAGIFLVIGLLRILLQFRISWLFILSYAAVFTVAAFTAPDYLAVALDSGGVTTGPITVPFVLALGAGVSAVRGGKSVEEDSFGLCGLVSIGPIIAVVIMGMFFDPSATGFAFETVTSVSSLSQLIGLYLQGLRAFSKEVAIALSPIVIIFGVFQVVSMRLPKRQIIKIVVGLVYTLVGLSIFLTGVNIGFMPAGTLLGGTLASLPYNWILYPLSVLIGFFVVAAEPAVHVLNKQVEDITSGAISQKLMMTGLSFGVGFSLLLAMIRMISGISIWYFALPAYTIAMLLTFFVPQVFTAIAFDSGGVAAGTMAAAFLLPFATGVSETLGGNPLTDAFGIVGLVATLPLISIQVMGVIYKMKLKRAETAESMQVVDEAETRGQVVELR
ncbi:MAG: DUF1538 domain-containing protein [Limnochordia bacterium]|jgi:hypothetical protein